MVVLITPYILSSRTLCLISSLTYGFKRPKSQASKQIRALKSSSDWNAMCDNCAELLTFFGPSPKRRARYYNRSLI